MFLYILVLISDRDLWWAVRPRGRTRPAVRPHDPRILRHPRITTRRRHSEQVRGVDVCGCVCMCVCSPDCDMAACLCVAEGTASFLLTMNKERTTGPCYQMWVQTPGCPTETSRRHISSKAESVFTIILSFDRLSREALEKPGWYPRIHGRTVIYFNIKTVFFMCALWQKGRCWTQVFVYIILGNSILA